MCSCPVIVFVQVNVSKFHIFILKSLEHEANSLPVLSKVKQFTVLEWALVDFSLENSSHSQTIITASSDPVTRML